MYDRMHDMDHSRDYHDLPSGRKSKAIQTISSWTYVVLQHMPGFRSPGYTGKIVVGQE